VLIFYRLRFKVESELVGLGDFLASGMSPVSSAITENDKPTNPEIRPLAPLVLPATLTQYNQWGQRIDDLQTSEGWGKLKEAGIRGGFVSNAYKRNEFREHSRTFSFAKIMLMTGDFHVVRINIPLALNY
jgi:hypothetical protein